MQLPTHSTYRPTLPLLIWDGQCGFCKYWVIRWYHITGGSVRYVPYQNIHHRIEEIPEKAFGEAVRLIGTDGKIYSGAHAVYRTLHHTPKWRFLFYWYRKWIWFKKISDLGYRLVSDNRAALYKLTKLLFGKDPHKPKHYWVLYFVVFLFIVVWALS